MTELTRRGALGAAGVAGGGLLGVAGARDDSWGTDGQRERPGHRRQTEQVDGGTLVGTWAASHHAPATEGPSVEGFADQTLRQVLHTSVGGDGLRLRLANTHGEQPLHVSRVTVGLRDGERSVVPDSVSEVTFGGLSEVTVSVGARRYSDPVSLPVDADRDVVVDVHLPLETGGTSWHNFGKDRAFVAPGDATGTPGGDQFSTGPGAAYYFVDGLDVVSPDASGTVVALGDSITDGANSTIGANVTYPDVLSRRILDRSDVRKSVVNAGMNGNRLLHNGPPGMVFGPSGVTRLDRDVLTQTGVTDVIVLLGVNDILHDVYGIAPGLPVSAELLVQGLDGIVRRCHAAGVRVTGGTITPFGDVLDDEAPQRTRATVNEWIRTSGTFDAVADFAAALAADGDETRLAAEYDSGDGLHPNDAGYAAMAEAVDLDAFADDGTAEPEPTTTAPTSTPTTSSPSGDGGDGGDGGQCDDGQGGGSGADPGADGSGVSFDFGPVDVTIDW